MDYRKELEALMAETAALAAATAVAIAHKPPVAGPQAPLDLAVSILNEPSRPAPPHYDYGPSEREQISKRVENFRAHQERFRREREDHYSKIMTRVRDAAEGRGPPDEF
ncbi:hypothetical protein IVB55_18165 [Bradyrhizobium sp. CW4]|jgi:hypothetical protein|uniref:hypothetical protein n=1 Tax=Bradyrhizobium sp. CW4 TaxID=2782687 RepID=UPI001FFB7BE7|nr:hypothetical protein [Bradyrhizobium sp. CW4]MCK1414861.1 hypothetical protein [Bradyrhizobium sp. CW4]